MKCNKCGCEIKENQKFCTNCGAILPYNINCPNCGSMVSSEDSFCINCGTPLKETININGSTSESKQSQSKNVNVFMALLSGFLRICLIASIVVFVYYLFITSKSYSPDINDSDDNYPKPIAFTNRARNCEDSTVKDLVIQIFKENDATYLKVKPETVASVYLKYPAAISYDSSVDKYTCSGTVVVNAVKNGFRYDYDFMGMVTKDLGYTYDSDDFTKKYNYAGYECQVDYTSQLSEGQILVSASSCGTGDIYEGKRAPKFFKSPNPTIYKDLSKPKPVAKPNPKPAAKVETKPKVPVNTAKNIGTINTKPVQTETYSNDLNIREDVNQENVQINPQIQEEQERKKYVEDALF